MGILAATEQQLSPHSPYYTTHERVHRVFRCVAVISAFALIVSLGIAQTTTTTSSQAPLPQDLNKYPGLLTEFGQLFQRLQREIKLPPGRSQSRLLPLLPESTVLYAAMPNYGDASHQALAVFRNELQQSSVLRDWWQHGDMATNGPQMEDALEKFYQLSQYLGDEIVVSGAPVGAKTPSLLILAEVRKPGLKDFLQGMSKDLPDNKKMTLRLLDVADLATAKERRSTEDLLVLVRPDFMVAALDVKTLRNLNARLDAGRGGLASTPFGQRLAQAYEGSATIVAAADLQQLMKQIPVDNAQNQKIFEGTGFNDAKYLVLEHKDVAGQAASQAELSFTGPRHGIASWLSSPGPLESLTFVSPQAMMAGAVLLKSPAAIFDDITDLASASNPNALASLAQMEQGLKLSLKDDLLRPLAGEIALEVESVTQSGAAWELVLRVNDPDHLKKTLSTLLATAPVSAKQFEEGGITYNTLQIPSGQKTTEIGYAFADGFLVVASSRETLAKAIQRHRSGDSLAKSAKYLALLPPGHLAQVSGVFYEDPVAMAALNMQRISPEMAAAFSQPGTESPAALICAYGEESALREVSRSGGADVGVGLIVAAIAIPNLLRARMAANEAAAVGSVRTLDTTQISYSVAYPQRGYAPDLASLGPDPDGRPESPAHAGWVDASLADSTCTAGNWCTKSGYRFNIASTCRMRKCSEYVVLATPVSDSTGTRSFCSTSDGVVRFKTGPPLTSTIRASECRAWPPMQ